jgi:hypothetical protein
MTYQNIRVSLFVFERFLKSINGFMLTMALATLLCVLVLDFPILKAGLADLFSKIGQIETIEIPNFKAAFKADAIGRTTQVFQRLSDEMKANLTADMHILKPEWFVRLLNVGAQGKLCDYERPTAEMREDYATDRQLEALGLITLETSQEVKNEVLKEMRMKKSLGQPWEIGAPRSCYVTTMTERGWNVKTAIVEFLTAGFFGATAPAAEARRWGREKIARAEPR